MNTLTPREIQVVELCAAGLSNKLIARQLGMSPETVKDRLARVSVKLGVRGRAGIAVKAMQLGLFGGAR